MSATDEGTADLGAHETVAQLIGRPIQWAPVIPKH